MMQAGNYFWIRSSDEVLMVCNCSIINAHNVSAKSGNDLKKICSRCENITEL